MALGLNAGLGNLGVSVLQFVVPVIIGFSLFGALAGMARLLNLVKFYIYKMLLLFGLFQLLL